MIYEYKIADPNVASREATVPYQDFLDGKVAMTLMNPWGMGLVTPESAVYEKYAIVPLPQVDPAKPAAPLYAYYWAVNAQTTDERKREAAFKLVGFLASQPGPWLKNVNFIQPKVGWNELPEAQEFPFFDVWAGEMLKGKFLPGHPKGAGNRQHHAADDRVVGPDRCRHRRRRWTPPRPRSRRCWSRLAGSRSGGHGTSRIDQRPRGRTTVRFPELPTATRYGCARQTITLSRQADISDADESHRTDPRPGRTGPPRQRRFRLTHLQRRNLWGFVVRGAGDLLFRRLQHLSRSRGPSTSASSTTASSIRRALSA